MLNLVKSVDEVQADKQQQMQQAQQMELTKQEAALQSTPMMDPSKNPQLLNGTNESNPPEEGPPPEAAGA